MASVRSTPVRMEEKPSLAVSVLKGLALGLAVLLAGCVVLTMAVLWWGGEVPNARLLLLFNYLCAGLASFLAARNHRHQGWLVGSVCALAYGLTVLLALWCWGIREGWHLLGFFITTITLLLLGALSGMIGVNL